MANLKNNKFLFGSLIALLILLFYIVLGEAKITTKDDIRWQKVDSLRQESLPKSALELTEKIYSEAILRKDEPTMLRSLIYKIQLTTSINENDFLKEIKTLELFAETSNNKVIRSIAYVHLAKLYQAYFLSNTHNISNRRAIVGYIPEDKTEWSGNIFLQHIFNLLKAATSEKVLLKNALVKDYLILFNNFDDVYLRPTVYDVIAHDYIQIYENLRPFTQTYVQQNNPDIQNLFSHINSFIKTSFLSDTWQTTHQIAMMYQHVLQYHYEKNNKEALIKADIDRVAQFASLSKQDSIYVLALDTQISNYNDNPLVVHVVANKANWLISNGKKKQAYEICDLYIKKFPDYDRIDVLKNIQSLIQQPIVSSMVNTVAYPQLNTPIKLTYANVDTIYLHIYSVNMSLSEYEVVRYQHNQQINRNKIYTRKIVVNPTVDFMPLDTTIYYNFNRSGIYEYEIEANKIMQPHRLKGAVFVTKLIANYKVVGNRVDVRVVDRLSGKGIKKAEVQVSQNYNRQRISSNNFIQGKETNKKGMVLFELPSNTSYRFTVKHKNDSFLPANSVYLYNYQTEYNKELSEFSLFTDRALYRPEQIVYVKGIAWKATEDSTKMNSNVVVNLRLRDANYQLISEQQHSTNEFGSFSSSFVLPKNASTGIYIIETDGYSTQFLVEEYKKPSFKIEYKRIGNIYNYKDTVRILGDAKMYMGFPLQNVKGNYTVSKQLLHWRWGLPGTEKQLLSTGVFQTNTQGEFMIDVIPSANDNEHNLLYQYSIETTITNTTGESQQAIITFLVGKQHKKLKSNIPTTILKENIPPFIVDIVDANNNILEQQAKYQLYLLKEDNDKFDSHVDSLSTNKLLATGTFQSNQAFVIKQLNTYPSGRYRMLIYEQNDCEKVITDTIHFTLFSKKDKKPPYPANFWFYVINDTLRVGERAEVLIGSSFSDIDAMFEIATKDKLLCRKFIKINQEMKLISFPFINKCGEELEISFLFNKNDKLYLQNQRLHKKNEDKSLHITYNTFRDHLTPNTKEEFYLSIKDANNKPVKAEVAVSMYDASLDAILPHNWDFNPIFTPYWYYPTWQSSSSFPYYLVQTGIRNYLNEKSFNLPAINTFGSDIIYFQGNRRMLMALQQKVGFAQNQLPSTLDFALEEDVVSQVESSNTPPRKDIVIRENFAETAFFYPQLQTNDKGETMYSFTVPESLTQWKLITLVHTKDGKVGKKVDVFETKKMLSIIPTLPRFVHRNDSILLQAKVFNYTPQKIYATVEWEVSDAFTNKVLAKQQTNIEIDSLQSLSTSLPLRVNTNSDGITIKAIVYTDQISDGEQHFVPVLSNRVVVTESMPISITQKGIHTFKFDSFAQKQSTSIENRMFRVDFSANAIWYALQALPDIIRTDNEHTMSLMAQLYALTVGSFIVENTPQFKKYIQLRAFDNQSPLQKNNEISQIALNHTPWVNNANNESAQISNLIAFLDKNQIEYQQKVLLDKIIKLQTINGGFSWFTGMPDNDFITLYVLEMMAKINQKTLFNPLSNDNLMIQNAINYLDNSIIKTYTEHSKIPQNNDISAYMLNALYVRSLYQQYEQSNELTTANQYFSNLLSKKWRNLSLFEKSLAAKYFYYTNQKHLATNIIESLLQYTTVDNNLGMYWANNTSRHSWYQRAISTHVSLLEAIHLIQPDTATEEKLKLWLLNNKKTTMWQDEISTIDAIHSLLFTGNTTLSAASSIELKVGDSIILSNPSNPYGLIQKTFEQDKINKALSTIQITTTDNTVGWGAAYWQYEEDINRVNAVSNQNLIITKQLFLEKVVKEKIVLVPLYNNEANVGDRIITRLVLKVNQDMDFVHIKDNRAAALESVYQKSLYHFSPQASYYMQPKDNHTNFYFDRLSKGTYVIEYPLWVTFKGNFDGGISIVQSMYAPQFRSHSNSQKLIIK